MINNKLSNKFKDMMKSGTDKTQEQSKEEIDMQIKLDKELE